jgi:hypothetical protein
MKRWMTRAALLAATAVLSACGGGGGSTPETTYDLDAASTNLTTAARSFTLTATATNGAVLTLVWSIEPVGPAVFPLTNTTGHRVDSSVAITSGSIELVSGTQQSFFDTSQKGLGSVLPFGACSKAGDMPLPSDAVPGSSGDLGTDLIYETCTLTAPVIGSIAGTWSLEQKSFDAVYLCANTRQLDAAGSEVSRESDCVEVAPDGTIGTRARVTLNVQGVVITFAN